ncbi:cytidyltransferase [Rummeliibacillus pycnus]|uniref:cytidyltransferase n=1 Tax=Rummeliibacillus pycnus TaxID=101070 RepID=UPI0037CA24EB
MEIIEFNAELNVKKYRAKNPCVLALGFFDGVHNGHRELLEVARSIAKEKSLELSVMTFFPHPSNVLPNKKKVNQYLTPKEGKVAIFEELNIDKVYIVNFDSHFSKLPYEQFIEDYIMGLCCKHVVAGFDFTFGHMGKGNMDILQKESRNRFGVSVIKKVEYKNEKISSSAIRELLNKGNVAKIPHYLGNPYCVNGTLRRQTNGLFIDVAGQYLLPAPGLYIVEIEMKHVSYIENCIISNNHAIRILQDFTTFMKFDQQLKIKLHILEKQPYTVYQLPIQSTDLGGELNEKISIVY